MPLRPTALADLGDAALLNRAIYGGADALRDAFLDDRDPTADPAPADNRAALNVYDRYDAALAGSGYRVLSSADLGFDPAEVSASDLTDGLDRNFTYAGGLWRNTFQDLGGGAPVPFTDAGAVALTAVKDGVLHLAFRGTDADLGRDGEAGTALGQARYYRQLKPLIDQVHDYAAEASNGVDRVVVSGQSLGGQMADIFALYDGARFEALPDVDLQVVSLASAGVEPGLFALMPGADLSRLTAPEWYLQYAHGEDIVYFPERYDAARHARTDPEQAPVTAAATTTLRDHLHVEGNLIEMLAPAVPQYEVSARFETNFLAQHYADFYELTGRAFATAAKGVDLGAFDAFVALFGLNPNLVGVSGTNNVNVWGLPEDDRADFRDGLAAAGADLFVLGLSGDDRIRTGAGDDLIAGGAGDDTLFGHGGADILRGGAGRDRLFGGTGDDALEGGAGADRLDGGPGSDTLRGGAGADVFVFRRERAVDTVRDFEDGVDRIDLTRHDAFSRWADVRRSLDAVEGGVELAKDGHTILLLDVGIAELGREDFLL